MGIASYCRDRHRFPQRHRRRRRRQCVRDLRAANSWFGQSARRRRVARPTGCLANLAG